MSGFGAAHRILVDLGFEEGYPGPVDKAFGALLKTVRNNA